MLRWAVRQRRAWVAFGAAVLAPVLTISDGRWGWTGLVLAVTSFLAVVSVRAAYEEDHPDLAERRAAREQARVDEILAKYEAERAARAAPPGRHATPRDEPR